MTPSLLAAIIVVATTVIGFASIIVVARRKGADPVREPSPAARRAIRVLIFSAVAMTALVVAAIAALSIPLD